jgi:hypothetical protein
MKRFSGHALFVGAAVMVFAGGPVREAYAIPKFAEEFKAMYVKDGTPLAAAVKESKCNVCHVAGTKHVKRNAYGNALAERLDKKEDAKNVEKIRKALEEVAALPSDPAKADAPTFGQLIADGKLPGGGAQ